MGKFKKGSGHFLKLLCFEGWVDRLTLRTAFPWRCCARIWRPFAIRMIYKSLHFMSVLQGIHTGNLQLLMVFCETAWELAVNIWSSQVLHKCCIWIFELMGLAQGLTAHSPTLPRTGHEIHGFHHYTARCSKMSARIQSRTDRKLTKNRPFQPDTLRFRIFTSHDPSCATFLWSFLWVLRAVICR